MEKKKNKKNDSKIRFDEDLTEEVSDKKKKTTKKNSSKKKDKIVKEVSKNKKSNLKSDKKEKDVEVLELEEEASDKQINDIIDDEDIYLEVLDDSKKKNNTLFKVLMGILIVLSIVLLFGFGYYYLILPSITLKGGKSVTVEYGTKYKEKGYVSKHFGKDITSKVKVKNNINHDKLGKYEVTYSVKNKGLNKRVIRSVSLVDTKKPGMNIDSSDVYVCPGDEYIKEKVEAIDNYDGDISNKVSVDLTKEKDKVVYSVIDSSGNKETITKNILYEDKEAPVIKLNGSDIVYTFVGEQFNDPLYEVTDNCYSDFTNKVIVDGSVNINVVGEYNLKYIVKDEAGNEASVSRKVFVKKRDVPGTVYLTFDDGPKEGTTNIILDILKEEGVEATFFVTNGGPDYLIKRMYDEGHTVALHTASHNYQTVYTSVDGYYNDLYTVQERVKRITGVESKIIRFPGGSSNTVSRKYNQGIMSVLTQDVVNRGFKYYDWNVSSGDAAGGNPTATDIYNNVIYSLRKDRVNMVLMHDIKTYTRDALRDIIRYGKNNGYTFEKITMDTAMIKQKVNN